MTAWALMPLMIATCCVYWTIERNSSPRSSFINLTSSGFSMRSLFNYGPRVTTRPSDSVCLDRKREAQEPDQRGNSKLVSAARPGGVAPPGRRALGRGGGERRRANRRHDLAGEQVE